MNSHLTPQQLLSYLDGELPKAEIANTAQHLHSCWTCRTEIERLERDIAVILDAHHESFAPSMPQPPSAWPSFDALMAKTEPQPKKSWVRFREALQSFFMPARGIAFAALIAVIAVLVVFKLDTHTVSAKEVLRQVCVANDKHNEIPTAQVIKQHVHIRRLLKGQNQSQSEAMDVWKSRRATVWKSSEAEGEESAVIALREEYAANGVAIDLPLSSSTVDAWRKLAGGEPAIKSEGKELDLSFTKTSELSADGLSSVSLRIQPETWRIAKMTLQFQDATFEITEDNLSLVAVSALPYSLLAELEPGSGSVNGRAQPSVGRSVAETVLSPEINLDAVQLNVLMTLHQLHADLGEPVTVTHTSQRVDVSVWQLPPERQNEIRMALQNEPGVTVQTTAPVRRKGEMTPAISRPLSEASAKIMVAPDVEDETLAKFFGSAEKEQAFTNKLLDQSSMVLAHLYALRNLQAQFPPERERALSSADRAQLASIVADHGAAAASALRALQDQISPLNTLFHVAATRPESDDSATSWQDESVDALSTARSTDRLFRSVFTTSEIPVSPRDALPQIQQLLSHLVVEVHGLRKM
ncbi:MAG: hypothetical protein PW792_10095 [Acidobacteriaceae bacterium]|nr:hypothetical protein [Acidobacteriaceae bacterium]